MFWHKRTRRLRRTVGILGLVLLSSALSASAQQDDAARAASPRTITATPPPMDMVWQARDANRIPDQPIWGLQYTNGISAYPDARDCFDLSDWFQNPACSTQHPRYDTASFPKSVICSIGSTSPLAGHVNWYPSTYTAPVRYSEKSFDQDINIDVFTGGAGYTTTSGGRIHSEFDSRETINNFTTPWWTSFRNAVEDSDAAAAAMIDGRLAVVTGLMGTDCEHNCQVESHPVWGLGIRTKSDFGDERWGLFMRNWGNEGYCSRYQHHLILDPRQMTLRLPWRAGATGVQIAPATIFRANVSGLSVRIVPTPNAYVEVTFTLPDPAVHGRVHGDLYLRWLGRAATEEPLVADIPDEVFLMGERSAEGRLKELVRGMTLAQREVYESQLPAQAKAAGDRSGVRVRLAPASPPSEPPLKRARVVSLPDPDTTADDLLRLKALLKAYDGRLPGIDVDASTLGLEPPPDEPRP